MELAGDSAGSDVNGGITGSDRCDSGRQSVRRRNYVDNTAGIDSPAYSADNGCGGADVDIDSDRSVSLIHNERSRTEGDVGDRNINVDSELRSKAVVGLASGSDDSLACGDSSHGDGIGNSGVSGEAHAAAGDNGPFNTLSCILSGEDGGFHTAGVVETTQADVISAELDGGCNVRSHINGDGVGAFDGGVIVGDLRIDLSGAIGIAAQKTLTGESKGALTNYAGLGAGDGIAVHIELNGCTISDVTGVDSEDNILVILNVGHGRSDSGAVGRKSGGAEHGSEHARQQQHGNKLLHVLHFKNPPYEIYSLNLTSHSISQ